MSIKTTPRQTQMTAETNSARVARATEHNGVCEEDIRRRACEIYAARAASGQLGDELSDWLQAERELSSRLS
jgi:hypothetical protein